MEQIHLSLIEPERDNDFWLDWLIEEKKNVRLRFGRDEEAIRYFPDDYYEKMENWWSTDSRQIDPVRLERDNGIYRIVDGWHRVAISHKIGLQFVPAILEIKDAYTQDNYIQVQP